jgi:hypothetical protein
MYSAPYKVFTVDDYEAKYYALLRLAAGQDISCIATANPSTVVVLAERLGQHTEQIIRDVHDGTFSADFAIPASIRAELRLHPDPERAHHLEQAAAQADGRPAPRSGVAEAGGDRLLEGRHGDLLPLPVRDLLPAATPGPGSGVSRHRAQRIVPLSDEGDAGVVAPLAMPLRCEANDGGPRR